MALYALAGILIVVAAWAVVRMNRGHALGAALVLFERSYDDAFRATPSKRDALRRALKVFEATPKVRELREEDVDAIVEIVGTAGDPKRVIREIVVRLSAAAVLEALRNRIFLTELAAATSKGGRARIEESYLRCAQEAFGAAKEFAALREELNAEAGTLASVARNLSRTVDYDQFSRKAADLEARVEALAERAGSSHEPANPDYSRQRVIAWKHERLRMSTE